MVNNLASPARYYKPIYRIPLLGRLRPANEHRLYVCCTLLRCRTTILYGLACQAIRRTITSGLMSHSRSVSANAGSGNIVFFLLWWLLYIRAAQAQAIDPDNINFKSISGWKDLRGCLQYVFDACYGSWGCHENVAGSVQCLTNACLCRPSTLGAAIQAARAQALKECQNLDDQAQAETIVVDYCASRGYTSIVSPTVLPSTGASTATVTSFFTVTVSSSGPTRTTVVSNATANFLHLNGLKYFGCTVFVLSVSFLECVVFLRIRRLTSIPGARKQSSDHRDQLVNSRHGFKRQSVDSC